jgi:hypothetical protein
MSALKFALLPLLFCRLQECRISAGNILLTARFLQQVTVETQTEINGSVKAVYVSKTRE